MLPLIKPIPVNSGLRQLLVADVNILIGDDVFDANAESYREIICVLGEEQREIVLRTIATAETQIHARLQGRVPARRQRRPTTVHAGDSTDVEKNADRERRRVLDIMLTKRAAEQAEVAAGEVVMRIMTAIAQNSAKEPTSSITAIKSLLKTLDERHCARFDYFHHQKANEHFQD